MTLRVVLDTNVIVSAALATRSELLPAGRPSICVALALTDAVILIASEELLTEYAEVLARPHFGIPHGQVNRFVGALRHHAQIVTPAPLRTASCTPRMRTSLRPRLAARPISS